MSEVKKPKRPAWTPPSNLDQRVNQFDGLVESWLGRLLAYVSKRWPRLGAWLAG